MAVTGHAWLNKGMRLLESAACLVLFLLDMTAGVVAWTITAASVATFLVLPSGALGETAGPPDGDGEAI